MCIKLERGSAYIIIKSSKYSYCVQRFCGEHSWCGLFHEPNVLDRLTWGSARLLGYERWLYKEVCNHQDVELFNVKPFVRLTLNSHWIEERGVQGVALASLSFQKGFQRKSWGSWRWSAKWERQLKLNLTWERYCCNQLKFCR